MKLNQLLEEYEVEIGDSQVNSSGKSVGGVSGKTNYVRYNVGGKAVNITIFRDGRDITQQVLDSTSNVKEQILNVIKSKMGDPSFNKTHDINSWDFKLTPDASQKSGFRISYQPD